MKRARCEPDDNPGWPAVAGEGSSSAPGRTFDESHRDGGGQAESRSEANRDGSYPPGEGPSRRANEEWLNATPGAARAPGGTRNGVNAQNARGAESQHPTPEGGDAGGVDTQRNERQANNSQGGQYPPVGNTNPGHRNPFLQPVARAQQANTQRRANRNNTERSPDPEPPPPPPPPPDPAPGSGAERQPHPHERVYPGPPPPRRNHSPGKKNMKASVKIAALNIKGRGNPDVRHGDNKWYNVWQIIREQKIGVLIVGEAHLDDKHKIDIDNLFGRAIQVEFTPDEEAPAAQNIAKRVIVPGRAMILEMKNVDGSPLSVLGVYAPNRSSVNAAFWNKIKDWYIRHPTVRRPDILGGDTNFVEDALDRLPAHTTTGERSAAEAFEDLKRYLGLIDGWRATYPTTCAYTFIQPVALGARQSRLDRIYIKQSLFEDTFEWEIHTVGIETDHRMVSVRLTTEDAPTIGHGRWVWPAHIIRDKTLAKFIQDEGLELQDEMSAIELQEQNGQWNPNHNLQTLWADFKTKICNRARERAKIVVPKIVEEIAEIKNKMDVIVADKDLSEEEKTLSGAVLQEKLTRRSDRLILD
ncbi:hypothetical protein C8J57DRAFT_1224337 [Mycena rebaudengoi]|nr:hypothetical protein C8J57DRAFT_1224337 [Mycena rebaudengoi]